MAIESIKTTNMKKLILVVCLLTLQVTFSQSRKSKEKAFKQVVYLIENANGFNYDKSIEIMSHDFDDLTITIKSTVIIPFSGGNKTQNLVQLDLNNLKKVEEKEELSRKSSVVMTFRKDYKSETINDRESSFSYTDYATVSFEKDSEDVDIFIKALKVLM
jgi:hypothetical protein|tara:strand:+ start:51 stop:530 length:480 start_codon:yes stop_codon:yes gene_type:complete